MNSIAAVSSGFLANTVPSGGHPVMGAVLAVPDGAATAGLLGVCLVLLALYLRFGWGKK